MKTKDLSWMDFKNCEGMDPSMFFERYEDEIAVQIEVDDKCRNCVVRLQCREYAEEEGLEGGVFGRKFFPLK